MIRTVGINEYNAIRKKKEYPVHNVVCFYQGRWLALSTMGLDRAFPTRDEAVSWLRELR